MQNPKLLPYSSQQLLDKFTVLRDGLDRHWDAVDAAYQPLLARDALQQKSDALDTALVEFQRTYNAEMSLAEKEQANRKAAIMDTKTAAATELHSQEATFGSEIAALEKEIAAKKAALATARTQARTDRDAKIAALAGEYDAAITHHREAATATLSELQTSYTAARAAYVEAMNLLQACWNETDTKALLKDVTPAPMTRTMTKATTATEESTPTVSQSTTAEAATVSSGSAGE